MSESATNRLDALQERAHADAVQFTGIATALEQAGFEQVHSPRRSTPRFSQTVEGNDCILTCDPILGHQGMYEVNFSAYTPHEPDWTLHLSAPAASIPGIVQSHLVRVSELAATKKQLLTAADVSKEGGETV